MFWFDIPGIGLVVIAALLVGIAKVCADEYKKRASAKNVDTPLLFSLSGILLLVLIEVFLLAVGVPWQLALVGLLAYSVYAVWKYRKRKEP